MHGHSLLRVASNHVDIGTKCIHFNTTEATYRRKHQTAITHKPIELKSEQNIEFPTYFEADKMMF